MKIGIIGGGISGLLTAHLLGKHHSVTVFEANNYVGGHTNTVTVDEGDRQLAIDTGFIVFNDRTYPNFIKLLHALDVKSQKTQMSFSVRCERTGLEYRGADLNGLFAQRRNLVNAKFWKLLYDLLRLKRFAQVVLDDDEEGESVGEFLARHRFSPQFVEQYFLPMGSAIWSCPHEKFQQFPIRFVAEFYQNHGLLGVDDRPQWRVISGGSREYVKKLVSSFQNRIHLNSPVTRIERSDDRVRVKVCGTERHDFDHVVFACHSDQALRILGHTATPLEQEILSCFPYEKNVAMLHTQHDVLPRNRRAWAAWNYFRPRDEENKATVTYNMNLLQSIESRRTYCVTLNDTGRIQSDNVIEQFIYHHPTFNSKRREMQQRHHELIGPNRTSFCGAYWGNGFHEDGVNSALAVCNVLSGSREFASNNEQRRVVHI